jgi:alanyl-tRNA synthetase
VHAALRNVLGDHVAQKGSLVNDQHLRFDFSHYEAMSAEELDAVESEVNIKIQENIPLTEERNVPIEEAREKGAMMLFGEKYGENVRIITFDEDYSVELCGGTHVGATGEIGYFRFTGESSVAAGIRRIEAVCGKAADHLLREEKNLIRNIKGIIGNQEDPVESIRRLIDDKKGVEKELHKIQMASSSNKLDEILTKSTLIEGISVSKGEIHGADMHALKQLGYDALQKRGENTVVVLGSRLIEDGKVFLMVAITDDVIQSKNLKAGALVGKLGRLVGGGGGGQPNLATAGGKNPEKLDDALSMVDSIIIESI